MWEPRATQENNALRLLQVQLVSNLLRGFKQISLPQADRQSLLGASGSEVPKGSRC